MRSVLRALVFVTIALLCAAVSNLVAGSERKLLWAGSVGAKPSGPPAASAPPSKAETKPAAVVAKAEYPPHPEKPWVEVSGEGVAALHARGDAPFLDARRSSVYREGHIAGARAFAVWEADVDEKVKGFYGEGHDPSTPIVVYCSGGECEDSHMLGQKLFFAGFNNVLVYKDGFPDWERRGLAVTKGEKP